ncbi:hypothetical protein BpHYR1_038306, partial [Brachionus plicatilis]
KKWPDYKEFLEYCDKEWIKSKNFGWFEGHAPGYPSINNALEGTNQSIKKVHTFRDRIPFSHSFERAKIILNRWSTDQVTIKKWEDEPMIKDAYWIDALAYEQKKPFLKYDKTCDIYLLTLDKMVDLEQYLDNLECDGDCIDECEFTSIHSFGITIRFVWWNWKFSSCSCRDYLKDYMCQHIIVVLLSKKSIQVPEKYLDSVIVILANELAHAKENTTWSYKRPYMF